MGLRPDTLKWGNMVSAGFQMASSHSCHFLWMPRGWGEQFPAPPLHHKHTPPTPATWILAPPYLGQRWQRLLLTPKSPKQTNSPCDIYPKGHFTEFLLIVLVADFFFKSFVSLRKRWGRVQGCLPSCLTVCLSHPRDESSGSNRASPTKLWKNARIHAGTRDGGLASNEVISFGGVFDSIRELKKEKISQSERTVGAYWNSENAYKKNLAVQLLSLGYFSEGGAGPTGDYWLAGLQDAKVTSTSTRPNGLKLTFADA